MTACGHDSVQVISTDDTDRGDGENATLYGVCLQCGLQVWKTLGPDFADYDDSPGVWVEDHDEPADEDEQTEDEDE